MAYTEKVLLSSTALSFLFYECVNSDKSQEGFLIGDVTTEVTNHISDSQSENARLDTQISIRTVLPLPSVSLFYFPTGRIKEDVLSNLLSNTANEVVGWYKYRQNTSIKPTFRDKLISKGLQKYFEKYHGKKNFVTCNLSSKASSAGSTHSFMYRFGKINCLDMYEYIEDVTANLGEKLTGYKKPHQLPHQCVFNKIVRDCSAASNNSSDAILHIQRAVDVRLRNEAKLATKNEHTIKELEAEIKQMTTILTDRHSAELYATYNKILEDKFKNRDVEMTQECVEAMKTPLKVDILNSDVPTPCNRFTDSESSGQLIENETNEQSVSTLVTSSSTKPVLNYAAALKNKNELASTSKSNNYSDDLITFDVEDRHVKKLLIVNDDVKCVGDSSPEY